MGRTAAFRGIGCAAILAGILFMGGWADAGPASFLSHLVSSSWAAEEGFSLDEPSEDSGKKESSDAKTEDPQAGEEKEMEDILTFWGIIKAGGITEVFIILLSIVGLGLSVEHFISIREKKLITPKLADNVAELILEGNLSKAKKFCAADKSLMGMILSEGLRRADVSEAAVKDAIQEAGARGAADLEQKISYLNYIGTTEPLLGLLGTVTGMIVCFNTIAFSEGLGKPGLLAYGVSQALITTASGLIVSIPIMTFFFYFKNKVRKVLIKAEEQANSVIYAVGRVYAKGVGTAEDATSGPPRSEKENA